MQRGVDEKEKEERSGGHKMDKKYKIEDAQCTITVLARATIISFKLCILLSYFKLQVLCLKSFIGVRVFNFLK